MNNAGVGSWPERRLRIGPERDAIRFEGVTRTYRELALRCRQVAGVLRDGGVRPGDRVAYLGLNHPAALETLFACGLLGAVWVPINARLTPDEVDYVLSDSGASIVFHGREHVDHVRALRPRTPGVRTWVAVEGEATAGMPAYEQSLIGAASDPIDTDVAPDDLCLLMYTSGTTGRPKGAMLTHANMTWNAMNQILSQDIHSDERTMAIAPLFHIGGLGGSVTPTLVHGGLVVMLRAFDAGTVLETVQTERITSFFAAPTIIDLLWRHPTWDSTDLSSLRTISVAGAPLPETLITPWVERGVDIQQAYGLTEAAPSVSMLDRRDVTTKLGSAGRMCFFTDVRVVDGSGREVGPGVVGEVVVQGPNVLPGYWHLPEETALALRDGWLHTGDAASTDEDGYLYIRDRLKDMYISGGENVYPAEVENALMRLPGVAEAAVIAVPDERWQEAGLAFVVATDGALLDPDRLRADLRPHLAGFKVPRSIRIVEALPRTASGKVRKPALREAVAGSGALNPGRLPG